MISLEQDNFRVELSFLACWNNKLYNCYRFWDKEFQTEPLFTGSDYCSSSMVEIESIQAIADLLTFLSCTRDDVEPEYFDKYNSTQLEWLDNWGERLELLKSWCSDLDELSNIAETLYSLSNDDDFIEWNEWREYDDGEGYYPVRLQYFNDSFNLYYGCSQMDTDHRGDWGDGSITEGMTEQECWDLVLDLKEQCLTMEAMK